MVPNNPARRISTCSGCLGGAAAAGRTIVMSPAAPDSFAVIFRFGADDGARAIGAIRAVGAVDPVAPQRPHRLSAGYVSADSPAFI